MSVTLPVTFVGAPLNPEFNGNLQQLFDAFVARLSIESQQDLSFFVSGSTAPTSNVGPWLKDGTTWYVWDVASGAYVPQNLEPLSLKYIASNATPDQNKYTFWIELDTNGKAQAIKYYSTGAWRSVYDDSFLAVIAQIDAVSDKTKAYPFRAYKSSAAQAITSGAGESQIVFDAESFDPDSRFASNAYTAPVNGYYQFKASAAFNPTSGTPTGIDIQIKLKVNGSLITRSPGQATDNNSGVVTTVSDLVYLTTGQVVDVYAEISSTGAGDWDITNDVIATFFEGYKVQSA
jgi:hypothetical protein